MKKRNLNSTILSIVWKIYLYGYIIFSYNHVEDWGAVLCLSTFLVLVMIHFCQWDIKIPFFLSACHCKHKISQLQKIKQLKRNMVCKYKFVLINNKYNLYFNSFAKEYPLILSSLNLTRIRDLLDFGWKMDWTVFTTNL